MEARRAKLDLIISDVESGPDITWNNFQLKLEFRDYSNIACELIFTEVSHFKLLSSAEPSVSGLSDDGAYEIVDSKLIASLKACGEIDPDEECKHWLVGFNEVGSFVEVVFKSFTELKP